MPLGFLHAYKRTATAGGSSAQVTHGFTLNATSNYGVKDGSGYYAPPNGVVNALKQEADNSLTETQPDGSQFHYATTGKLASARNVGGGRWTVLYNASGFITSVSSPSGSRTTAVYDNTTSKLKRIVQPSGRITTFTTTTGTPSGALRSMITPDGSITTFTLNTVSGPFAWQDPSGNRTTLVHDTVNANLVSALISPSGQRTTYSSSNFVQDALGNRTTLGYDGSAQLKYILEPTGSRTTLTWLSGLIQSLVNGLGQRTTLTRSTLANRASGISSVQDAAGGRWTILYDTNSRVNALLDPLGNRSTLVWDTSGRRTALINPLGQRTSWTYGSLGQITAVTDALENQSTRVFNTSGALTAEVNPLGSCFPK
jgi:YD repeat-containing protein